MVRKVLTLGAAHVLFTTVVFVINEYLLTLCRLTRHCQWKGRQKASTKDLVLFILTLFVCA